MSLCGVSCCYPCIPAIPKRQQRAKTDRSGSRYSSVVLLSIDVHHRNFCAKLTVGGTGRTIPTIVCQEVLPLPSWRIVRRRAKVPTNLKALLVSAQLCAVTHHAPLCLADTTHQRIKFAAGNAWIAQGQPAASIKRFAASTRPSHRRAGGL